MPEKITPGAANDFINALYENGEFYHLDHSARTIINIHTEQRVFNDMDADRLDQVIGEAFTRFDLWELPVIDRILFEPFSEEE